MKVYLSPRARLAALAPIVILVFLAGCASNRSFGSNVDDFNADTSLKRILLVNREHDYSDIDITVFEGRVMLTGTMRSPEGQTKLVENAFRAPNVIQVIDETVLNNKTPFKQGVTDGRIDQALKARLITDRGITSRNFKIAVSAGTTYLLGVARDEEELVRVLNHAKSTRGVRRVVSHILYQDDPTRFARTHN